MKTENKDKSFIEHAMELYGEQRYFTEEEREIYNRITDEESTPIGINVFDLYKEKQKE